jgi:hypothetical protein
VRFRADVLLEFHLHQRLRQYPHPFTQPITLLDSRLAQDFGNCHSQLVGHRLWVLSSVLRQTR